MKKILLIGINTRPMVNSAIKLNYEIYSTSFFSCYDRIKLKNEKSIINETNNLKFNEKYNSLKLIELASDYIDEVDYIIPISGISPNDFNKKDKKKILGNKEIEKVEDKYKFYKKIKNEYNTPKTFKLNDIDEAFEIIKNNEINKYIIKPVAGSGGYGVNFLNKDKFNQLNNNKFILQEYIDGKSISSSVLSTKDEAKTIINSQLLTSKDYNKNNEFIYIGNIIPLKIEKKEVLNKINMISEKLINKFKLIGSNGVDYILKDDEPYILEINPRIQGTYECCEKVLGINMLESHIKACKGEIISTTFKPKLYSYKKILYADNKLKYNHLNLNNIYDLPYPNTIIEKDEPILTIIENNTNYETLIKNVKNTSEKIRKNQLNVK